MGKYRNARRFKRGYFQTESETGREAEGEKVRTEENERGPQVNYRLNPGDSAQVTAWGPLQLVLVTNSHGELYEAYTFGVPRALPVHLREAQAFINVCLSQAGLSKVGRQILNHIFTEFEGRFNLIA